MNKDYSLPTHLYKLAKIGDIHSISSCVPLIKNSVFLLQNKVFNHCILTVPIISPLLHIKNEDCISKRCIMYAYNRYRTNLKILKSCVQSHSVLDLAAVKEIDTKLSTEANCKVCIHTTEHSVQKSLHL